MNNTRNSIIWKTKEKRTFSLPIIANPNIIQAEISYESIFDSKDPPGVLQTIFKYTFATIAAVLELFVGRLLAPKSDDTIIRGP